MPLSAQNFPHALESTSAVAWFCLLTITPAGQQPFHLVNNTEPVISRGIEFKPYPFNFVLPTDDGETLPKVSIVIDNLAGEIIRAIRAELQPPRIDLEIVTSAFPDLVEKRLNFLRLRSVTYNAMTIEGSLETVNVLTAKFPRADYTATEFPGLFR
jgi:hypothetical protein